MQTWLGTAAVALSAIGWGTWALFVRGSGVPPAWQSVGILAVIALAWALPAVLQGRARPRRSPRLWAALGLLGVCDAGNYVTFFGAVNRGPIGVAVLTHYLAPLVVALGAPLLLKEPLGRRTLPAALASIAGLALLLMGGQHAGSIALTAALGAASALFYGANTLLSKKLLGPFGAAEALAWHCAASAVLLLPLCGPLPDWHAFVGRPLAGALVVGAGGGAVFYFGLERIPAQRAAVLTYLEPLVASLVGAFAFGERMGPLGALGGALILAAGAAVVAEKPPREQT